jgi:hypothetical protein
MIVGTNAGKRIAWMSEHRSPAADWTGEGGHRFEVVGVGSGHWHSIDADRVKSLSIDREVQEAHGRRALTLSKAMTPGKPVHRSSTFKVGEGRDECAAGKAVDLPTALAAVRSCSHEHRELGGHVCWCESSHRWISWRGRFALSAFKSATSSEVRWIFEIRGEAGHGRPSA